MPLSFFSLTHYPLHCKQKKQNNFQYNELLLIPEMFYDRLILPRTTRARGLQYYFGQCHGINSGGNLPVAVFLCRIQQILSGNQDSITNISDFLLIARSTRLSSSIFSLRGGRCCLPALYWLFFITALFFAVFSYRVHFFLDFPTRRIYNNKADNQTRSEKSEQLWRSRVAWSSAHDWKSCNGQKPFEGSNPSFSAKKTLKSQWFQGFLLFFSLIFPLLRDCWTT